MILEMPVTNSDNMKIELLVRPSSSRGVVLMMGAMKHDFFIVFLEDFFVFVRCALVMMRKRMKRRRERKKKIK